MKHKPIQSLRDQISDQIRTDIISGELQPGQKLREEVLAERFGVSRGPIRDVLLQLTKEGLLASKRNCGVSVNDTLAHEHQALMIDLRLRIESHCLRLLKGRLTDADFEALEKMIRDLGEALEKERFTAATEIDLSFHRYLVHAAGGDDLVNIWTPIVLRMRMSYQRISSPEQSIREHTRILHALRAGDKREAVQALKDNVR